LAIKNQKSINPKYFSVKKLPIKWIQGILLIEKCVVGQFDTIDFCLMVLNK